MNRLLELFQSKKFFYIISALALSIMMLMNIQTRPTYDEAIERAYGKAALEYYLSAGKDTSFLDPYSEGWNTSFPEMRYYGTGFEMIPAVYTKWISSKNEFLFRHILNTLFGFIAFVFAALILIELEGYIAGSIIMIILLISPTFIGLSALENKVIPLTLGYTSSVYFLIRLLRNLPQIKWLHALGAVLSIALAVSIRVAGLIVIFYFGLFALAVLFRKDIRQLKVLIKIRILAFMALFCILGAGIGLLFYPNLFYTGFDHLRESLDMVKHFKSLYLLFEGNQISNQTAPWYYLYKIFGLTVPLILLIGFAISLLTYYFRKKYELSHLVILFSLLFPVITLTIQKASVYNGWRHVAFVYPCFSIIVAIGFINFFSLIKNKSIRIFSSIMLLALLVQPIAWLPGNYRYNYAYYNLLAGNYMKNVQGKYEMDFYSLGTLHCYDRLYKSKLKQIDEPVIITSNNPILVEYAKDRGMINDNIQIEYNSFSSFSMHDWDFCILSPRLISLKILDRFYPPKKTIHRESIKRVVNAALIERENKFDFQGSEMISRNSPREALSNLQKAYEYNPNNYQVWYLLGLAHYMSGNHSDAITYLLPYTRLKPGNDGHFYLGMSYYLEGQYQEAAGYLEIVMGNMGSATANRMAILYCGQAHLQLKNYNNALSIFENGLKQSPGDRNLLTALVNTCTQMGDLERASSYREQLRAL